ncbi:hypothetical protein [Streptomyces sp. NPDC005244]|uniref:hypothetical protein n=1 Tax=Streptomyces sp. NPDC005244 TaxID=3364708 RepID=UPI00368DE235
MPVTTTPRPTGHPGFSATLPRRAESAATVRRLARTTVAACDLEGQTENAAVVITELLSNAGDHGRFTSIRVIVSRPTDNWVRLGVVDRSRAIPLMQTTIHSAHAGLHRHTQRLHHSGLWGGGRAARTPADLARRPSPADCQYTVHAVKAKVAGR